MTNPLSALLIVVTLALLGLGLGKLLSCWVKRVYKGLHPKEDDSS